MVFSMNTITSSKDNKDIFKAPTEDKGVQLENTSFFFEALDFALEENKAFNATMIESYSLEEGSLLYKTLTYALSQIDPLNIINKIFEGFINLIKKLFGKFKVLLLGLLSKENALRYLKSKIINNTDDIFLSKSYYIYTKLGVSGSLASFKTEFEKEYASLDAKLSKFKFCKTKDELHASLIDIKNDIDNTTSFFDKQRGLACNREDSISSEEYNKALYDLFRVQKIENETIKPDQIHQMYNEYVDCAKYVKLADKEQNDIERAARNIQKRFNSMKLTSYYTEEELSLEEKNMFISIIQNETLRVKEMLNIYLFYYSNKLDAIKECATSYKSTLYTILQKIVEQGGE